MKKFILFTISHVVALGLGFAAGVYALPILIAPAAPSAAEIEAMARSAPYTGTFRRDLKGSDWLHWGEGTVAVSSKAITLLGRLAPGPDYKLYLTPEFVETEADFARVRARSVQVGEVKTFDNFAVPLRQAVDVSRYDTVVVWCETFSEFITAAQYR